MKIIQCIALCIVVVISQQAFAQELLQQGATPYLSQYTPLEREKWLEEEHPLKLRVLGGISYDSNLIRLPDDAPTPASESGKDDMIYTLGAGGKYELRQSRQKFIAEANVSEYKFQNFDNLDNTSYDLRGEWLWQAGNDWSGNLGTGRKRYLENFANFQENVRDLVDQNRVYGSANYLLHSHLKLSVNTGFYDTEHGEATRNSLDSKIINTAFTVNWVTPAQNTVGLQYRTSDARFPNEEIVATTLIRNAYHENEYSVVAHWVASGVSDLVGRLGYTDRKFDELPQRDYSAPTWRLVYLWQATGKTALEFATWREIAEFEDLTSNYVRATGVSFVPRWSITRQVVLQGKISYENRDYVGDPGLVPIAEPRKDKDNLYQIAALWTPLRLTELALTLESGRRSSNQAFAEYKYEATSLVVTHYF